MKIETEKVGGDEVIELCLGIAVPRKRKIAVEPVATARSSMAPPYSTRGVEIVLGELLHEPQVEHSMT